MKNATIIGMLRLLSNRQSMDRTLADCNLALRCLYVEVICFYFFKYFYVLSIFYHDPDDWKHTHCFWLICSRSCVTTFFFNFYNFFYTQDYRLYALYNYLSSHQSSWICIITLLYKELYVVFIISKTSYILSLYGGKCAIKPFSYPESPENDTLIAAHCSTGAFWAATGRRAWLTGSDLYLCLLDLGCVFDQSLSYWLDHCLSSCWKQRVKNKVWHGGRSYGTHHCYWVTANFQIGFIFSADCINSTLSYGNLKCSEIVMYEWMNEFVCQ